MDHRFLDLLVQALAKCISGIPLTLELLATSVAAGLLLAIPFSIVHSRRSGPFYWFTWAFTYLFTGTPLLVQLYLLYYGSSNFDIVRQGISDPFFGKFMKGAFFWVWLALTLNTAAYSTEIFAGALRNTDSGEIEAAHAAGLSNAQVMRRIILPSGLRRSLPAYSNEVLMLMHATSLASVVTLFEVTGQAKLFNSAHYAPFSAFGAAALVYLVLTFLLVGGFRQLEKRYLRHLEH